MPRIGHLLALALVAVAPAAAAQQKTQTPDVLPVPTGNGGPSGPATDAPPAKPVNPAAGYAYDDKAPKGTVSRRYRAKGPVVNMPGFEQTGDGGSRLFVQLSQTVPVEERRAQGSITYVLKGASPRVHNNTNALVTVHFNTPVSRARLVPSGADLHFIVELRAAATPTWKLNEGQDKSATLAIDFPKGDFLGIATTTPEGEAPKPTPPPPGQKRRGRGPGKAPPPAAPPAPAGPKP